MIRYFRCYVMQAINYGKMWEWSGMSGSLISSRSALLELADYRATSPNSCVALSDLSCGDTGILHRIDFTGLTRLRLLDLGFTHGTVVELVRKGPGGTVVAVRVRGTLLALRCQDAAKMLVALQC